MTVMPAGHLSVGGRICEARGSEPLAGYCGVAQLVGHSVVTRAECGFESHPRSQTSGG